MTDRYIIAFDGLDRMGKDTLLNNFEAETRFNPHIRNSIFVHERFAHRYGTLAKTIFGLEGGHANSLSNALAISEILEIMSEYSRGYQGNVFVGRGFVSSLAYAYARKCPIEMIYNTLYTIDAIMNKGQSGDTKFKYHSIIFVHDEKQVLVDRGEKSDSFPVTNFHNIRGKFSSIHEIINKDDAWPLLSSEFINTTHHTPETLEQYVKHRIQLKTGRTI